jgi:hypothetical protein
MYLSYGVLETSGGDLRLGEFGGIDDLFLDVGVDPAALSVPDDELARWPGLEPTRLWRNVNLIPDFATVTRRATAMFEVATGLPIDGVIQIDPAGLAAVLAGVGPVEVEGVGVVDATNAVAVTVNEAYTLFPDRDQRQEVLGDVAEAAFQRLVDGDYPSLRPLGRAIADAVAQRHILFSSPQAGATDPIAHFHADGALPSADVTDAFLLTTLNRGRDKLDFYLDSAVTITGVRTVGGIDTVDVEVTLANGAPAGVDEPFYVFGGDRGELEPGTYTGIVSLYVPNGTALVTSPEVQAAEVILQTEDARTVVGWPVLIAAEATHTVRFQLRLPPRSDDYSLRVDPVARIRPTTWDITLDTGGGTIVTRSGPLDRSEVVEPR